MRSPTCSHYMPCSIMVGTTDHLTAAIPGSHDRRVTIRSIVSFFWPEVMTSARTVEFLWVYA